jgi:hypothetical protein
MPSLCLVLCCVEAVEYPNELCVFCVCGVVVMQPFARYKDDADLDALQRETQRWGDPLAHLSRKSTDSKRKAEAAHAQAMAAASVEALNASAAASSSSSSSAAAKPPAPKRQVKRLPRPRYVGAPWPNRFSIAPGYRCVVPALRLHLSVLRVCF